MRKPKLKNERLKAKEIELYCHSVEEILTKIQDRISRKKSKGTEIYEIPEEELIFCNQ